MYKTIKEEERSIQFKTDTDLEVAIDNEMEINYNLPKQRYLGCEILHDIIEKMNKTLKFSSVYLKEKFFAQKRYYAYIYCSCSSQ